MDTQKKQSISDIFARAALIGVGTGIGTYAYQAVYQAASHNVADSLERGLFVGVGAAVATAAVAGLHRAFSK